MRTYLHIAFVALVLSETLAADTLTFESFVDGAELTNQFVNVTFANATVLTSGVGLNEFEFPPRSGQNVAFDDGGPITLVFGSSVLNFSAYLTYAVPVTVVAFDAGNTVVSQATSLYGSNLALSGDPGSTPNELLTVASSGGIARITIAGDPFGGSFVMDDLTYTSAVPEPVYFPLIISGVALLSVFRKNQKKI